MTTLPRIVEIKRTLAGNEKRFRCSVLYREGTHLVVLYVLPEAMSVHGTELPAGTVTFGHFWSNRPYNVYHWLDGATGATIGHYVNLAAETTFSEDTLSWLDLVVDVLLLPGQAPRVLDEDEIPPAIEQSLRAQMVAAQEAVLDDAPALEVELERFRVWLWPLLSTGASKDASP